MGMVGVTASQDEPEALRLSMISAGYLDQPVLDSVDLYVRRHEIVALLGRNGAGKSTVFRAAFGIIPLRRGVVTVGKKVISRPQPQFLLREGVAYVPQASNVFVGMSVAENLGLTADAVSTSTRRDGIEIALEAFPELKGRLEDPAGSLSGGLRQMLAIGRALAIRPNVLLLDEPAAGLAAEVSRRLFQILQDRASRGAAVLVAEHQHELAMSFADRAYTLADGIAVPTEVSLTRTSARFALPRTDGA